MEKNTGSLESQPSEKFRWAKDLPCRYVLTILGFVGFFNSCAVRANLSVALVAMVNSREDDTSSDGNDSWIQECPDLLDSSENQTDPITLNKEFNWDAETQANILGSFFYGYFIAQLPGGILSKKYGAKWLFGLAVLISSVLTLLSPLAARHGGASALIAVRVIEGLAEGSTYPSMEFLVAKWSPVMERSRILTLIHVGCPAGTVITTIASGYLCGSTIFGGWPSAFYVFGILGCVWFIFWAFLVYENPSDHPRISKAELLLIQENQGIESKEERQIPWKAMLTSVPMWGLLLASYGQYWGFYTMLAELPTYLHSILHFNIQKNGVLSSLPYIGYVGFGNIASYFADRIRSSGKIQITTVRKIMNSIGYFGSALCIGCVVFAGCNPVLIMSLLVLSMTLSGCTFSGITSTALDMSPKYAGIIIGLTHTFANTAGFISPAVVGSIIKSGSTSRNWHTVFLITSAIYVVTGIIFNIFCSADLQQWESPPLKQKKSENELHSETSTI